MLHDFIVANREQITSRARHWATARLSPGSSPADAERGIEVFLSQLLNALAQTNPTTALHVLSVGAASERTDDRAALQARKLIWRGFSTVQVVLSYEDVCQSVTQLAFASNQEVRVGDFHVFNRCLDEAIAGVAIAGEERREGALPSQHRSAAPLSFVPPRSERGAPEATGNGSRSGVYCHEPKRRTI